MTILKQEILDYLDINIEIRYSNWDIGTTYNFGDIIFDDQYYFKSVIDNNLGLDPNYNQTMWLRWDVSNRFAQIDLRAQTKTVWDSTTATEPTDNALISTFANDRFNTFALGGVKGSSITVELFQTSNDALLWNYTLDTNPRPNTNTWYNYYFDAFDDRVQTLNSIMIFIPTYTIDSYFRVTIVADTIDTVTSAECAYMIAGKGDYVGCTLHAPTLGINDSSLIEEDEWGIITVNKRAVSRYMDADVYYPSEQTKTIERRVLSHVGSVVLFIGDESDNTSYENLLMLGYLEDFTAVLSNKVNTNASFSIKEII